MFRNLLLLTLLLARPKSHLCHHMRLGELIEMEFVEELLVNIRQAQDAFVWVNTILLDNGRILFYLLFVNSFKGLFAFPLLIRTLIFLDILEMFVAFLGGLKRSCIVWPSYISSSVQSDNRLFTAFRCSLDFEDSLGFWSNKAGITWTAFSAVDSYGVLFTHRLKRCVVSSIHFFPEAPFGSMNIFLFH